MNPNIADLAEHPRGRKWRSRLISYNADIRRMRQEGVSYKSIAVWLSGQGLQISGSAVHAYVRARARRKQPEYQLPALECPEMTMSFLTNQSLLDPSAGHMHSANKEVASPIKEFIYTDRSEEHNPLNDDDLSFNDPLANPTAELTI